YLWQPNIAFPFFLLFLVLVWDAITGRPRSLIGVAGVGTFVVQIHLGYAPIVIVPALCALAVVVYDYRRNRAESDGAALRKTLLWTAGVTVALWIPALIQTALHPPGNLYRIVRGTLSNSEPGAGLRDGAGWMAG